jgi:hypothetical protein
MPMPVAKQSISDRRLRSIGSGTARRMPASMHKTPASEPERRTARRSGSKRAAPALPSRCGFLLNAERPLGLMGSVTVTDTAADRNAR